MFVRFWVTVTRLSEFRDLQQYSPCAFRSGLTMFKVVFLANYSLHTYSLAATGVSMLT